MNTLTDQQLLRDYTGRRSEAAFAELVRRHVDLVYSTALRIVRDGHLAQDVTQGSFLALAQNASQLTDHPVLTGWLHRTTQNLAAKTIRSDVRRRAREQEAATMNQLLATGPDTPWEHIAPHLDDALAELNEIDCDAVLLRYFENKSLREVGHQLGISDDTAQKRVSRAVEHLREFFVKRGLPVGASGLAVVISANAVQAAPAGLAATISAAATLAGTTIATTATATAIKTIAMTTAQKAIIGVTLAAAVGTGVYEARQNSKLREENQTLRKQAIETEALRAENQRLEKLRADAEQPAQLREEHLELLRLRGEVARLRRQASELETLRKEKDQLRTSVAFAENQTADGALPALWLADSNRVAAAKAVIFTGALGVAEKLEALRVLRSSDARCDDVMKQMIQAYYSTDNPKWRADVFRQLRGVTTPELKQTLLEAVHDTNQHTDIRQEAAKTLAGYLPDPDAKAWLEHLAANDADEPVRAEATRRLQAYQHRHGHNRHREQRKDPDLNWIGP